MTSFLGCTVREVPPQVTIERARSVFSQVGITRLANVTGLDTVGVPTWMAIRPLARSISVAQGKGLTHELAAASAAMESLEVYHAEHVRPKGCYAPLTVYKRDARFVDPTRLALQQQIDHYQGEPLLWARGQTIASRQERYIPAELFDLDLTRNRDKLLFVSSTNGLASGNTTEEAILHGLCELVERDQTSFWEVDRYYGATAAATRVALASVDDPACLSLIDKTTAAGLALFVWYASTTLNLPVFVCEIADLNGRTLFRQRASGFGCHPLKSVAFCRAVTEALQSRLTFITGTRDDVGWHVYQEAIRLAHPGNRRWIDHVTDEEDALDYRQLTGYTGPTDIGPMLAWSHRQLVEAGIEEALFVNLEQEGLGIPVVYVCAPGLEKRKAHSNYLPSERMMRFIEQSFS